MIHRIKTQKIATARRESTATQHEDTKQRQRETHLTAAAVENSGEIESVASEIGAKPPTKPGILRASEMAGKRGNAKKLQKRLF